MSNKLSLNPNEMEELANRFVYKISDIETEYKNLHIKLANLITSAPPEYTQCFFHVGDTWQTGNALVSRLSEMEQDIRMTADKFVERDNYIGKLYNLYDKYGTLTAMGALVGDQALYYGLGLTRFIKDADSGAFSFKHSNSLLSASRYIDQSKFKNLARGLLHPMNVIKKEFKNASFADLFHKRFAKYLPEDVINYSNSTKSLLVGIPEGRIDRSVVKNVLSTGKKFARTNAVSAFLVTGAVETVGMGLKISENYAKYGEQPEILKRENAKAVGNAVNNTVAIGGFAIGGAVIGGAIGSLGGPVGTVVGATIGSAAGGFAGEFAAKFSAGFAEKVAITFQDPIQDGIDGLKNVYSTAGNVVEKLDDAKDKINEEIKETFKDPIAKVKDIGNGFSKAKDTASTLVDGAKNFLGKKLSFI